MHRAPLLSCHCRPTSVFSRVFERRGIAAEPEVAVTKLLPEHLGLPLKQQRERVEGFLAHLALQLEQPALRDVIVVDDPGPAAVLVNLLELEEEAQAAAMPRP